MLNYRNYITADPRICHGKLTFTDTRIMVYLVLELIEAGEAPEQILKAYPPLTKNHIRAALHLAVDMLKNQEYVPLAEVS